MISGFHSWVYLWEKETHFVQKACVHPKTWAEMCIAASFIIAKKRKQSKRPPIDEWIKKMHIHTKEYYSATEKE